MSTQGDDLAAILAEDDRDYIRTVTVSVPRVRQALWDEHARLEALLPTLTSDTIDVHPDLEATAARIAELESEMDESAVTFKLSAVGHRRWADLMREHPPKKEHRGLDHNPETFPQAAIAAALGVEVEQVEALIGKPWFNETCWYKLWQACLDLNVGQATPKSLAAGLILRRSGVSGTTVVNGESLGLSSSVE